MSSLRSPREGSYSSSSFRRKHNFHEDDEDEEEIRSKLPPSRAFGIGHQNHGAVGTSYYSSVTGMTATTFNSSMNGSGRNFSSSQGKLDAVGSYYGHNNDDKDNDEYIKAAKREQREKTKNGLILASISSPYVEEEPVPRALAGAHRSYATNYDKTKKGQHNEMPGRNKTSIVRLASGSENENEVHANIDGINADRANQPRTRSIVHPGAVAVAVGNNAASNRHTNADVENTADEVPVPEAINNDGDATAVDGVRVDVYNGKAVAENDSQEYKTWQAVCIELVVFVIIGACAGVAVAVTVGLLLGDNGGNEGNGTNDMTNSSSSPPVTTFFPSTTSPTQEPVPTQEPFSQEFEELWSRIGNDITINGDLIRSDRDSVQHKAFMWLVDENQQNMFSSVELVQRYVAVLFYMATGGEDWTYQLDFLNSESSVCQWNDGVTGRGFRCVGDSVYVDFVRIENNNMAGTLPDELGLLEDLVQIVVDENENISGTIPIQIFSLTSLIWVSFRSNSLTGTIPTEVGQLRALENLLVGHNYLTGVVPSELSLCTNLESFDVQKNILEGTLPTEIGLITEVTSLNGSSNDFIGSIPSELGNLSRLEHLYLDNLMTLTGTIPSELGGLTGLTALSMFNDTQLTGTIPTEFGRLDQMEFLLLGPMPGLTGTIPTELGLMTDLQLFTLSGGQLTGTIPTEFGALVKLLQLIIAEIPSLTGTIPTEFGLMTALLAVWLYDTQLTGTVPTEFGLMTDLSWLLLNDTQLTGSVPTEMANLTRLTIFGAYNSTITGSVDDIFCYPNNPFILRDLVLDCLGDPPEIECSCCTECCNETDCIPV